MHKKDCQKFCKIFKNRPSGMPVLTARGVMRIYCFNKPMHHTHPEPTLNNLAHYAL